MGTTVNPLWTSLVPGGRNPTGANISVPAPPIPGDGVSGQNPYLPAASPKDSTNPYTSRGLVDPTRKNTAVPGAGPGTLPAFASPYSGAKLPSPVGTSATNNPNDPNYYSLYGSLQNLYGPGVSGAVFDLLNSGGGYNQDAVNAILAAMQPGIAEGRTNLLQEFSAQGGRFSSDAALGLASYDSQVQLNEGQIMAQMYMQAYQNYMNEVMGVAGAEQQYQESQPSWLDIFSGVSSTAGKGAELGLMAAGVI